MQVKCDFCGSMIDEKSERCPCCGAPLSGANRTSKEQPKTIEELRAWYIAHHLPPEEVTRFFIGKNITEPKAFGIYRDSNGDFVVYKNKSTGERAVRYKGADEKYAVNELYQRLKAEIADQKGTHPNHPQQPAVDTSYKKKKMRKHPPTSATPFLTLQVILKHVRKRLEKNVSSTLTSIQKKTSWISSTTGVKKT